jgi:hypothetical protein
VTRLQAWLLHLSVIALTVTGAVFAWMRYAMKTDDPFAVANHPWQPHILHLHVLAAPIAVFALGLVFAGHVWAKYESGTKARRRSGIGALWMIAPMVLSGYLMQVVTNESAILAMKVTHWVSSGIFVLAYLVHQVLRAKNGVALRSAPDRELAGDLQPVAVPADDENRGSSTAAARNA